MFGGDGVVHTLSAGGMGSVLAMGSFGMPSRAGNVEGGFATIPTRDEPARYVFSETTDSQYQHTSRDMRLSFGFGLQLYHEFVHYDRNWTDETRVVGEVNELRRPLGLPVRTFYAPVVFQLGTRSFLGTMD